MISLDKKDLDNTILRLNELNKLRQALQHDCDRLSKPISQRIKEMPPISGGSEAIMERAMAIYDIDFWARQYARCFFALVEGLTYNYKLFAVELPQRHYTFTQEERDIANEKNVKIRFLDNLDYCITFLGKAFDLSLRLKKSDHRFGWFKMGTGIRDKLMHPKSVDDLEIDYKTYGDFAEGVGWYYEQMSDILEQCHAQLITS